MKKLHLWIAALGVVGVLYGCSAETNKPEDSMAKILEQGKKDQGITDTSIVPKNAVGGKVDPATEKAKQGEKSKDGSKGVGAPTDDASGK